MEKFEHIVEWMRRAGVKTFTHAVNGETISIELGTQRLIPSGDAGSVAPADDAFSDGDGAGVCSCGHSWLEHTNEGCLHGCSHEVCTSTGGKDARDE